MNIGDESGCLTVIADNKQTEIEVQKNVIKWAEDEWNTFSKWKDIWYTVSFETYYNLDDSERVLFADHKNMPSSFVDKFRKADTDVITKENQFLWYDKNIKRGTNTKNELIDAYKLKKLYKVKCNICNRQFYIDEYSFKCVKWTSCVGAKCMVNVVDESGVDYSNSKYKWEEVSNAIQVLDYQLTQVESINGTPLTYYGLKDCLSIAYISDIHLMHHLKYYNNEKQMIRHIVKKLYDSIQDAKVIIFNGDISSNTKITVEFYTCFMRMYDYFEFCKFKRELKYVQQFEKRCKKIENKKKRILDYIDKKIDDISNFFDIRSFLKFKSNDYYSTYLQAFEEYEQTRKYKNYNLSCDDRQNIYTLIKLLDTKSKYEKELDGIDKKLDAYRREIYLEKYGKTIEEIKLTDYKHNTKNEVYAVLGNHEYIPFNNVQNCVSYYKGVFAKLGINFLHNNFYERDKYLIYGGTGFAKYDNSWNADTLQCCEEFSRQDEAFETTKFEQGYYEALRSATEKKLCFICAVHYPIYACLNGKYDKEAIYFTGHNHQNELIKLEDKILYADNQIGYENRNIAFKIAKTGYELNPYYTLEDGLYQTSIKDYKQFYKYIGEYIGDGTLLYQRCSNGKAHLYVLKRKGYYGFFIIKEEGDSKGISIVNGGKTKKLTKSTDIGWICENFDIVLSKYLQALLPLRRAEVELSKELKELGLSGAIHGCIVDIDFLHHIMINPIERIITFYYSQTYGKIIELETFEDVIKSMIEHKSIFDTRDYKELKKIYDIKSKGKNYLLKAIGINCLLEIEDSDNFQDRDEQVISRKEGMYAVSRKVKQLQRIFSGHVLRDFDLRLAETEQKKYRKYLYTNRMFWDDGILYKIIKDEGSDIVIAEELNQSYDEKNTTEIMNTGRTKKYNINILRNEIQSKKYDKFWTDENMLDNDNK